MKSASTVSRRWFIGAAATAVAGLSTRRLVSAQDEAVIATQIAENLFLATGAGGNVVVLRQPDGLLLVNGGNAARVPALLAFLKREFPDLPVRVLFNTDWCSDHTGLNASAGGAGARIVAHENTRLWLSTRVNRQWQQQVYEPLPQAARPSETFYVSAESPFGHERVTSRHLGQGHTDGDICVFFQSANVLVAGHAVGVGSYPVMDVSTGGWIGGLVSATRTMLDVANSNTRIVASQGAPQPRSYVQEQHDMLVTVRDRCVKMMKSGLSAAEMIATAPTKEFDARWGSPDLFMRNMYPGLWGHARELGGIV